MDIALPAISKYLEKQLSVFATQADLVHNIRIGREPLSYASLKIARSYDIPFVFTPVHHPRWVGWRYRFYHRLYRMADLVLALTDAEKRILMDLGVREDRIAVIGMGPVLATKSDPVIFLKKYQIDGPMVLFIGTHYPYKGYQQLLQATRYVWQKQPDTHFVFIGSAVNHSEGYFECYEDRRIHRLGILDLQEKTNALAACKLLCVPSTQESFGGVYVEAWNFGKPVIGCDIPAVSEVVTNEVDGFLVAQEPIQIAERICDLISDNVLAELMGMAGRRKMTELYTWEKIALRVEKAYRRVLGK
jgi:glycosyltransferase involved in cell wall biosynthesis